MLTKTILLFTYCCFVFAATEQTTFHGMVYDAATQQPLENVTLHIAHTSIFTVTEKDGTFRLPQLPIQDSVYATYTGYKPYAFFMNPSQATVIIYLQSETAGLQDVTVN